MNTKRSKLIIGLMLLTIGFSAKAQNPVDEQDSISQTKERMAQFTFIPGIGTSRGASDGYTNRLSFNLLVGYEHSFIGGEFGLFYNMNKSDIKGAQLATFGNTVGGNVTGGQVAGFINTAGGNVKGIQYAGFMNTSGGGVTGAQVSGFMNIAKENVQGAQVVGFSNTADSIKGAQVAGFINTARRVKGAQVSGFINKAGSVHGSQIGIINIADSLSHGVSLGLFNIIKSGITQFSVEHNEVIDANLVFRSGTQRLYTTFLAGFQIEEDSLWTYGAGMGTQFRMSKHWVSNVEVTTQVINPKDGHTHDVNLLNRISLNLELQMAKHLAIAAGPVLNIYVTNKFNPETGQYGDDIALNTFFDETTTPNDHYGRFEGKATNVKMWIGYNVAIKF